MHETEERQGRENRRHPEEDHPWVGGQGLTQTCCDQCLNVGKHGGPLPRRGQKRFLRFRLPGCFDSGIENIKQSCERHRLV